MRLTQPCIFLRLALPFAGTGCALDHSATGVAPEPDAARPASASANARDGGANGQDEATPQGEDAAASAGPSCDHPPPPPIDPTLLVPCPSCVGGAHCIPLGLLDGVEPETLAKLAKCNESSACVPDPLISSSGFYRAPSCASLNGNEGRCLSACLPEVEDQLDILPQDTCAAFERCVPCFDPRTGEATGACDLACDEGPANPNPERFPSCCSELGMCVPRELVPEQDRTMLGRDSCRDAGAICAPSLLLEDDARPPACRSIGDSEGRCLPSCLPSLDGRRELLPRASCADGELCVPCFEPLSGDTTGACSIRGDEPSEPPVRFDTACCGNGGRCIPQELAGESMDDLPTDDCADEHGEGWVCAPRRAVEDPNTASRPFASCRIRAAFVTVAQGLCVPRCMIGNPSWGSRALGRNNCEHGEVCVPCAVAGDLPGC